LPPLPFYVQIRGEFVGVSRSNAAADVGRETNGRTRNISVGEISGLRVAMLQSNAINESLGLCDLSAHLRQRGATTRLFLRRDERDLAARLREFAPQLTVVPCDLLGHNAALSLAQFAKRTLGDRAATVLGGTHPTFFSNVVERDGVDFAFAGEAEGVVAELLAAICDRRDPQDIPNLIVRVNGGVRRNPLRPVIQDLDAMPLPDRNLYYRYPFMSSFPAKKFATARGCANSCGYCFNPSYRALLSAGPHFVRRKSPERVAREIDDVRRQHRLEVVHFSDDIFSTGAAWIERFAEVYREQVGLPFSCNAFASTLDENTVRRLKDAGCRILAIGVEVADDRVRRETLNKPVSLADIERAAALIKAAGIRLVTFNILGVPWLPPEGDLDTLALNQQIGAEHTRVTQLVPFPVSRMAAKLIEDGFLAADYEERIYDVPDIPSWPAATLFRRADPERLMRLYWLWALLLRFRVKKPWARRLINSRWSMVLAPLSFAIGLLAEKRVFGLGWADGLRYFRHVANPAFKTSNYVSFL
jgi:radical SAM superfamily enzyme YgiQ (UPF0313 family)